VCTYLLVYLLSIKCQYGYYDCVVEVMLWLTTSRPVCLGVKTPSVALDQIFTYVTVKLLWVCWCGAPSLMRGRVYLLQYLLALACLVILGSESHGTLSSVSSLPTSCRSTVVFEPAPTQGCIKGRSYFTTYGQSVSQYVLVLSRKLVVFYRGVCAAIWCSVLNNGF
jgi:hypothetical protein